MEHLAQLVRCRLCRRVDSPRRRATQQLKCKSGKSAIRSRTLRSWTVRVAAIGFLRGTKKQSGRRAKPTAACTTLTKSPRAMSPSNVPEQVTQQLPGLIASSNCCSVDPNHNQITFRLSRSPTRTFPRQSIQARSASEWFNSKGFKGALNDNRMVGLAKNNEQAPELHEKRHSDDHCQEKPKTK